MKRIVWLCLAALLLCSFPVMAADAGASVNVIEKGQIVTVSLNEYGEEQSQTDANAFVEKDGIAMVPSFVFGRLKNALSHTYDEKTGAIRFYDSGKELFYELKVGSDQVTVLDRNKTKQSGFTLSTAISLHLVGDYPCYPLDFFQKIGYGASFDGSRTITLDFRPKPAAAESDEPKLVPFSMGTKHGYMDESGTVAIEPEFDGAEPFSEGMAAVASEGKWGYIDATGKVVIMPRYDSVTAFSDGMAAVGIDMNGEWKFGYIDKTGKPMRDFDYDYALPFREGYALAAKGSTFAVINKSGTNLVYKSHDDAGPYSEGLAKVGRGDKYGFLNKRGEEQIPLQFEAGGDFSEGLAAVRSNGKWGYIGKDGTFAIEARFDHAGPFAEALAAVKIGDKYGFVDKSGQTAISPRFDAVGSFHNGYAPAMSANKWGYIDAKGDWAVQPAYDFAYGTAGSLFSVREGSRTIYLDAKGAEVRPRDKGGNEYVLVLVAGKVIEVNGRLLDLEVPPAVVQGSTLVPVRPILESLGLKLDWDPTAQTIKAVRQGLSVELQIDNPTARVNGANVALAVAPVIWNGSTLVPVRFISESAGAKVDYAPYRPVSLYEMGMHDAWSDFDGWAEEYNNADRATQIDMESKLQAEFNELDAMYRTAFSQAPDNDAAYMEYAVLLGELAQMFGSDELWDESAKMAASAARLNGDNAHYYMLYVADRTATEAEAIEQYRDAAEADPYLVLNHAAANGTYLDAAAAFGEMNGMKEFAVYCLKQAVRLGTAEAKEQAQTLLRGKYGM
ncbi:WG repeat-containing protein [Paenibacillus sp. GYB003]|uniref:WG repeat-containing protein n=1 Tax=Paenibacillus sp. GYB003 TaxID=2994392 RepID=UPI002F968586